MKKLLLITLSIHLTTQSHYNEITAIQKLPFSYRLKDNDGMPIWRSYNGWGNTADVTSDKVNNGVSNTPVHRTMKSQYSDNIGLPNGKTRKSPRIISNIIANNDQLSNKKNKFGLSAMAWSWGQFIDHDLIETPQNNSEQINIEIPLNDNTFHGIEFITHSRSTNVPNTGNLRNPRNQINAVTSFLDASMVYGSEHERANQLRTHYNGTLKFSKSGKYNLLPFNIDHIPNAGGDSRADLFIGGDVRANEQIGLTTLHILFMREHNRLCNEIKKILNINNDELIYQYARSIVIALTQQITYNEFLPALFGDEMDYYLTKYIDYDDTVNPAINSVFSSAAFRIGHTMLNNMLPVRDNNCRKITNITDINLDKAFFNPKPLLNNKIDMTGKILKGLTCIESNEIDPWHITEVRDKLFTGVMGLGQVPLDLISLNIDRGREHGIPDYNSVREYFHIRKLTDINDNVFVNSNDIKQAYDNVNDIDLFIGGLSEKQLPNSNLGPTFAAVIGDQFRRLRDGDRFWYERYFKGEILEWIKSQKLSDIILRNTDTANIQEWCMFISEKQPIRQRQSYKNLQFFGTSFVYRVPQTFVVDASTIFSGI